MKNIDWYDVFCVFCAVFMVVIVAAFLGCIIVPLLIRVGIDMWLWALA